MPEVMKNETWRTEKRKSLPLSISQIEKFKMFAKIQGYQAEVIIAVILDTGIRVSDLVRLEWSNILWEEQCIFYKSGKTKTQVRARVKKKTLKFLKKWKAISKGDRIIPVTRVTVANIIKRIAKDAGISRPVSPTDLCSTAMSLAAWRGLPQKVAEAQYGRTGATILTFYQKIPPEFQDKSFDETFENDE